MRRAHTTDLPAIRRLLEESGLPTEDLNALDLSLFVTTGRESSVDAVGGIEQYGHVGLIRSIATHSRLRGRGIGENTVRELEALAAAQRIETLYLLTESAEDYFRKLGYAKIERREVPLPIRESRQFSSLCPESATVMFKSVRA